MSRTTSTVIPRTSSKAVLLKTIVDIKGKGLTETVRQQQLSVDNFDNCLQQYTKQSVTQHTIRSDHHNLYSYKMNKIGLSAADDKRWIRDDGISTFAHGHYRTRTENCE